MGDKLACIITVCTIGLVRALIVSVDQIDGMLLDPLFTSNRDLISEF